MEYITEQLKTVVSGEYDVVVVGAGPAGVCAAIAAARNGAKTLLVERYGFLGGMWSAGLIIPLFDYENKSYVVTEIVDNIKRKNGWGGFCNIAFDFEIMKQVLDELITDSGCELLLHTFFAGAFVEDDTVKGIFVQNKSGRSLIRAKVVIDCTGDGDVAASAGVPFTIGRDSDNLCQPATCMFMLSGVDFVQQTPYHVHDLVVEASQKCGVPFPFSYKRPFVLPIPNSDRCVVMWSHIRGTVPMDAQGFSQTEMASRREIRQIVDYLQKYVPTFANAKLVAIAAQTGVRESRHIHGKYTLTCDDCVAGAKFEDAICNVSFSIDLHKPDTNEQDNIRVEEPYQIPYRCLVPINREGLLVAGRCISGTYESSGSYRVTGNCMATGQAAGVAASLAVKNNISVNLVNAEHIREIIDMK